MQKLVSVIVPAYNGENTITRCLNSILRQSYSVLEVIIVDDGSIDATGELCDSYAELDERIHVFHIENGGVSDAKNYGIEHAQGQYLAFLDADDWLYDDAIAALASEMNDSVDMVVGTYRKHYNGYHVNQRNMETIGSYTNKEYLVNTLRDPGHHYYGVNWNKLYRTDMILNDGIRFHTDITLGEDFVFNLEYWLKCRSVRAIPQKIVHYDCKSSGLSRTKFTGAEICQIEFDNRHRIWNAYHNVFEEIGLLETVQQKMNQYWINYDIRQRYHLKTYYRNWLESEKAEWENKLDTDPVISICVSSIPKKEYQYRKKRFFMFQGFKDSVKKMLRTLFGK